MNLKARDNANLNWSSDDVSQLLNSDASAATDEPSPQGSTKITTCVRSSNGVTTQNAPSQTVRIVDTNNYANQPSVECRGGAL